MDETDDYFSIVNFWGGWTSIIFRKVFWPKKSFLEEYLDKTIFSKLLNRVPGIYSKVGILVFFKLLNLAQADNMQDKFKICNGFQLNGNVTTQIVLGYKGWENPGGLPGARLKDSSGTINNFEQLCQAAFQKVMLNITANHNMTAGSECSESDSGFTQFWKYIYGGEPSEMDVNLAEIWKNDDTSNSFLTKLANFIQNFFQTDPDGKACLNAFDQWKNADASGVTTFIIVLVSSVIAVLGLGTLVGIWYKKPECCRGSNSERNLLLGGGSGESDFFKSHTISQEIALSTNEGLVNTILDKKPSPV